MSVKYLLPILRNIINNQVSIRVRCRGGVTGWNRVRGRGRVRVAVMAIIRGAVAEDMSVRFLLPILRNILNNQVSIRVRYTGRGRVKVEVGVELGLGSGL
jgi:hypothetical protein